MALFLLGFPVPLTWFDIMQPRLASRSQVEVLQTVLLPVHLAGERLEEGRKQTLCHCIALFSVAIILCTHAHSHKHTDTPLSADGNKLSHFAEGFPCPRKSNQHDYVGLQQWQDCFALSFFLTLQYKLFVNVSDKALNRSEMWLKGRL